MGKNPDFPSYFPLTSLLNIRGARSCFSVNTTKVTVSTLFYPSNFQLANSLTHTSFYTAQASQQLFYNPLPGRVKRLGATQKNDTRWFNTS
jgi:hypothetical protein